jgi:hypothetical protein
MLSAGDSARPAPDTFEPLSSWAPFVLLGL